MTAATASLSVRRQASPIERSVWHLALVDVAPVLLALVPFGLSVGVVIAETALWNLGALAGTLLMFSGAAYLAAISMLGSGAALAAVVATALLINARQAIYSAALAPRFRKQPTWFRIIAPYFLVDQLYAMTSRRPELDEDPAHLRTYWLVSGLAIGAVWVPAVSIGMTIGTTLPPAWALDLAMPLMITGLLVPMLTTRRKVAAAVAAATVVALVSIPGIAMLLAIGAGVMVGALANRASA